MWLKTAYVEEYGVLLSNMWVLWWRRGDEKQHRKWDIYERVVKEKCEEWSFLASHLYLFGVPRISDQRGTDEKQEKTILHIFKLSISKESGDLEKRETWKERKYQPCGRRHCNPPGKAA